MSVVIKCPLSSNVRCRQMSVVIKCPLSSSVRCRQMSVVIKFPSQLSVLFGKVAGQELLLLIETFVNKVQGDFRS